MGSKVRKTDVGSELENFLDTYEEDIPPRIFVELEKLGDDLETIEERYDDEISELKSRIEDLEVKLDEKQSEIDELEIKLSEV